MYVHTLTYLVRYRSVLAGKIRLIKPSAILKDKGILKIAVIKFNRISNYPTMVSFMYNFWIFHSSVFIF